MAGGTDGTSGQPRPPAPADVAALVIHLTDAVRTLDRLQMHVAAVYVCRAIEALGAVAPAMPECD